MGGVPIPTRGIHCGTLYMYVLCDFACCLIYIFVISDSLCGLLRNNGSLHRKKKVREFLVPSPAGMSLTTKLSLGGNNDAITELFLPSRGSLVSDIPAGDGKLVNLFLRCCHTNYDDLETGVLIF